MTVPTRRFAVACLSPTIGIILCSDARSPKRIAQWSDLVVRLPTMAIIRRVVINPDGSEEIWTPHKDENDQFVMATRRTSYPVHHQCNQVKVTLMKDVIEKLRTGQYHLRMSNGRTAPSLISPKSIEIVE